MDLVVPLVLSGLGVTVAALAFYNRDKPDWQRSMPVLMALAVGQVLLGVVAWMLVDR